jgi:threonine dehydratase
MMTIENHNGIHVLRDDLLPGGTKSVFMDKILDSQKEEFVYASPVYGGFQIALAAYATSIGKKAVIFCAKRKTPHPNSLKAKAAGANVFLVPAGYLKNCQSKAREYAARNNAQLIEFGANYPAAINAISDRMKQVISTLCQEPKEIFCAVGSGTLLKGIIAGTSTAKITGVMVGKEFEGSVPDRVKLLRYHKQFEKESKATAPFPSCSNYDLKAWEYCIDYARKKEDVFFWNVL